MNAFRHALTLLFWLASAAILTAGDPFSFVVFGDNQFATDNPTSGVPERMAVPEVVVSLKPDFVLHTGDLMDHGRDAEAYSQFVRFYSGMLSCVPFFPTMGNHDAGTVGIRNYKAYLEEQLFKRNAEVFGETYRETFGVAYGDDKTPYPTSFKDARVAEFRDRVPSGVTFKTYYAFRFGNSYFISCEQGTRWWSNTPKPWLENHLKQAADDKTIEHIFVYMHHPMYSSTMRETPPDPKKPGSGECIRPVRSTFEPLFRTYDVTMVFSGHAHLYDHFYVPDDGHETRSEKTQTTFPNDDSGIHYIVTGGGGGPLNRGGWVKDHSYRYFQKRLCAYHVTQVEVDGGRVRVTIHTVKGDAKAQETAVFDRFTLDSVPK